MVPHDSPSPDSLSIADSIEHAAIAPVDVLPNTQEFALSEMGEAATATIDPKNEAASAFPDEIETPEIAFSQPINAATNAIAPIIAVEPVATRAAPPQSAPSKMARGRNTFAAVALLGAACALSVGFDQSTNAPAVTPDVPASQSENLPPSVPLFTAPDAPKNPANPAQSPTQPPAVAPLNPNALPKLPPHAAWPKGQNPNGQTPQISPAEIAFNRAVEAQKVNDFPTAIAAYREALHLKPDLLPAHTNLAILYLQTKQSAQAISHLQSARKLEPKNPALPFQLAQVFLEIKRPAEAIAPLRDAVRLAPKNPQGRALLAQLYIAQKKPADALGQWQEIVRLAPKDANAHFTIGVLAMQLKRLPQAETALRRAVELEPRDVRGPLTLAQVQAARGKLADAERTAESAVHRFPKVIDGWTLLAQIRRDRRDALGAASALVSAARLVAAKNAAAAAPLWAEAGRILVQKSPREAARHFEKATELAPRVAEFHAMLAAARLKNGDKKGAIAEFDRTLQLDPKRLGERRQLALLLAQSEQWSRARREYKLFSEAQPKDVRALFEWAAVEEAAKQPLAAAALWQRGAKLLPENPLPQLQSARLLRLAGRDAEAMTRLRVALEIAPNAPNALLGLAQLEEKSGQTARALAHWRALVAVRPDDARALGSLVRASTKLSQNAATANTLRAIVEKNPKNIEAARAWLDAAQSSGGGKTARTQLKAIWERTKSPQMRRVLDEFDLARAKEKLKELESAPTPTATPSPTATPAPNPPTTKLPDAKVPAEKTPAAKVPPEKITAEIAPVETAKP